MLFEGLIGSLVGLAGSAFTSWNNRKMEEMKIQDNANKRAHELALIKAQTDATIAEVEANLKITIAKTAAEVDLAETAAYTESVKQNEKSYISSEWITHLMEGNVVERGIASTIIFLLAICEVAKDIMRPALSAYSVGVATWVTFKAYIIANTMDEPFTNEQVFNIINSANELAFFLATCSFTWWFADRSMNKFLQKRLTPTPPK